MGEDLGVEPTLFVHHDEERVEPRQPGRSARLHPRHPAGNVGQVEEQQIGQRAVLVNGQTDPVEVANRVFPIGITTASAPPGAIPVEPVTHRSQTRLGHATIGPASRAPAR